SPRLFASAMYSGAKGNFDLLPEGGLEPQTFIDTNGVWHNTYFAYQSRIAQRHVKADVSYFFSTGNLSHELKAGFNYLEANYNSASIWPGQGSNGLAQKTGGNLWDCAIPCAAIGRDGRFGVETRYWGAFASDTLTADRITVSLGLRWDEQYGF